METNVVEKGLKQSIHVQSTVNMEDEFCLGENSKNRIFWSLAGRVTSILEVFMDFSSRIQSKETSLYWKNFSKIVASLMEPPDMVTKQETEAPSIPWTTSFVPTCTLSWNF